MEQTEIVSDFVGQGPVQVEIHEEIVLISNPECLVVDDDSIMNAGCGRQIRKTHWRCSTVDLVQDPDIDVVSFGPLTESFHRELGCRVQEVVRDHARAGEAWNDSRNVGARDAR